VSFIFRYINYSFKIFSYLHIQNYSGAVFMDRFVYQPTNV